MPFSLKTIKDHAVSIVIIVLMAIIAFFAFRYNAAVLDHKEAMIKQLTDEVNAKAATIRSQEEQLALKGKSEATTTAVIESLQQELKDAKIKETAAEISAKQQMRAIDDKYSKLPKTAANEERRAVEISVARAKGLWATYCLQEPASAYCK